MAAATWKASMHLSLPGLTLEFAYPLDGPTVLHQVRLSHFQKLSADRLFPSYTAALVAFAFVTLSLGEPFTLILLCYI
jgi:hypothetical protein